MMAIIAIVALIVMIRIENETADTKRFWIEVPELERFDFVPGQFVTLDLPIHEKPNKRWRSYSIASSAAKLSGVDRLNPSHMYVVRSDSVKFYQANSLHLEQGFMQKGWNLGKGCFMRLAGGYFETAYAGVASEFLYYPAGSRFALGLESATVWKRHYDGIGFFHKIPRYDGVRYNYHPFTGFQCFLDL
jgi:hypothetical protein